MSVGRDIGWYQAAFITFVFVLFAAFFTIGTYAYWENARSIVLQNPEAGYAMPAYWAQIMAGTEVLGILGALIFMLTFRISRKSPAAKG